MEGDRTERLTRMESTLTPTRERLNQNIAHTYAGYKPADLMDGVGPCRARPFYHVPSSPGSVTPVESEFAYSGWITDSFGQDYVLFKFEWTTAPGDTHQIFKPHEIHRATCICRACKGDTLYHL